MPKKNVPAVAQPPAVLRRDLIAANHGDLKGREYAQSSREVKDAYRKLKAMGGLNILNEMMGIAATTVAQDTYRNPTNPAAYLTEQRRSAGRSRQAAEGWSVQVIIKETAGGKEMTRYRIKESDTGKAFGHDFRHENTASLVAACLNETGNPNDPRIRRIVQLSEQETSLIKEINLAKKLYKSVPTGNIKKRTVIENEIELNRLKLENVRLKMGV